MDSFRWRISLTARIKDYFVGFPWQAPVAIYTIVIYYYYNNNPLTLITPKMRAKWSNQNFKKPRIPCDKNFIIKATKQQYCQIDCDLNCETQYSILRDNSIWNQSFFQLIPESLIRKREKTFSSFFHEGKQLWYENS